MAGAGEGDDADLREKSEAGAAHFCLEMKL